MEIKVTEDVFTRWRIGRRDSIKESNAKEMIGCLFRAHRKQSDKSPIHVNPDRVSQPNRDDG